MGLKLPQGVLSDLVKCFVYCISDLHIGMNDLKNSFMLREIYIFALIRSDRIAGKVVKRAECFYVNYKLSFSSFNVRLLLFF